jgi:hypothetical protein
MQEDHACICWQPPVFHLTPPDWVLEAPLVRPVQSHVLQGPISLNTHGERVCVWQRGVVKLDFNWIGTRHILERVDYIEEK